MRYAFAKPIDTSHTHINDETTFDKQTPAAPPKLAFRNACI